MSKRKPPVAPYSLLLFALLLIGATAAYINHPVTAALSCR